VPSGDDLILPLLDDLPNLAKLLLRKPMVGCQIDLRLKPELRLAVRAEHMNVPSRLLPREEVQAVALPPQDRRTHASIIP